MVRSDDKPTRVRDAYKDYRWRHELVCSETPATASAGRPNYWHAKRQRRGPWPAARMPMLQGRKTHELRAPRERSGGPADRPTPTSETPACAARNTHQTPESTPRPAQTAPPPPPPAAVAQDVPHEADAREEDGPEPAHPPVDPHAHGQQDPLELEAAALAPHEARPLSRVPKKRVRLSL